MTRGRAGRRLPQARALAVFLCHLWYPTRVSAVRSLVSSVLVTRTLRRQGLRPLLQRADGATGVVDVERSVRIAAAVDAAFGVVPVAPTCLRRSVTLIRELDRLGLESVLHIGVRNVTGSVEAHAWVQVGAVVVNDAPETIATYLELASGELEQLWPLLR